MSLADELLADFGSDSDEQEFHVSPPAGDVVMENEQGDGNNERLKVDLSGLASTDHDVTTEDLAKNLSLQAVNISSMSTLMLELKPVLEQIEQVPPQIAIHESNVENNPTYQLLVRANNYSVEIDNEIFVIYRVVKEKYSKRFDELGSLVLRPVDYAKSVKAIGNDVKTLANNKEFTRILPKATSMVISMAAFENHGTLLSEQELASVYQGCDLILSLEDAKHKITDFVSSQLANFAPNITEIVGSHVSAQLMGFAGGLQGLAKTPSANIPSIGANRQVGIGFGHTGLRRQGFLYHSNIIQSVPADKRTQAMRIVAGKFVLAARVDLMHGSRNGSQGRTWRAEIGTRIEKLLEPPTNKGPKALPVPVEKASKKRGGKRIRKYKEQFQQTELQKAANRMAFGKEEETVLAYDESVGLGMAGMNSGNVRSMQLDGKTRAKMSKGMSSRVQGLNRTAQEALTDGLQSSLNFTPNVGIQLVDPSRNDSAKTSRDRWFSSGTFTQLNPKGPVQGEFVIPAVPSPASATKRKNSLSNQDNDPKRAKHEN